MDWRRYAKTRSVEIIKGYIYTDHINFFSDKLLTSKVPKGKIKKIINNEPLEKMHSRIQRIKVICQLNIPSDIIDLIIGYEELPEFQIQTFETPKLTEVCFNIPVGGQMYYDRPLQVDLSPPKLKLINKSVLTQLLK